ncbi:hypothetical protein K491DRAFT_683593 [Lophiostoma macrostomum CBS 122681]|uniref:Uncharacterized protein n=1 Tax=Lophiostoma macrostomum CBS 122681 TaxID=1314788 RepID=A0A6A6ST13_9PLEO|nr:hypothetical protein K491DRAFT_683593 [Lophiostoma macrostomum CBS 122681]
MTEELEKPMRRCTMEEDKDIDDPEKTLVDYFGTTDPGIIRVHIMDDLLDYNNNDYNEALFPYKAEGPLETPLPTVQEIHAAWQSAVGHYRKALRIGPYCIKVRTGAAIMREAENMIYLQKHSTVRTAKLYAAFSSREVDLFDIGEEGGPPLYHYLIQERIEGFVPLYDLIRDLDLHENRDALKKISNMMAEQLGRLRDTPPEDPNHFGRVNGQAYNSWTRAVRFPENRHAPSFGPFTYEGLLERMIHSSNIESAQNNYGSGGSFTQKELLRHARGPLLDHTTPNDGLPVLSHLDIKDDNILVKVTRSKKKGEVRNTVDVEDLVFIDWETLAWMPAWYEPGQSYWLSRESPFKLWQRFGFGNFRVFGHMNIVSYSYYRTCLDFWALAR